MSEHRQQPKQGAEPTAVDDVRRIREKIAREHGGNLREHIEQTTRIAQELRTKLKVRHVPVPPSDHQRDGTRG